VERTNNAVYDALTPDALQRSVLKYSAILAIKNDAYYSYKRGVIYFLQGKYEYAITDLENCIKWSQSSEMYQAHYYRGLILTRLARYREAVDAYTSAIETFSEATETKSTVVNSLRSTKRSISRFNHNVTASLITSLNIKDSVNVIGKQKQREQVEDIVDSLFQLKIDKNDIFNNRGLANLNIGNYDESISDLKQAGTSKHHFVFNLGYAYYFSSQYAEAIEYFQQAIQIAQDDAPKEYEIYLACALERTGEVEKAQETRKHLLIKHPNAQVDPFHYKFIPDAVMMEILSFMDHQVLAYVGRTCRTLYQLTKHDLLYKSVWVPKTGPYEMRNYQGYYQAMKDKKIENLYIDDHETNTITMGSLILPQQKLKRVKMSTGLYYINEYFLDVYDLSELEELYLSEPVPNDEYYDTDIDQMPTKILNAKEMPKLRKIVLRNCTFDDWDKVLASCGANLVLLEGPSLNQEIVLKHCPQLIHIGEKGDCKRYTCKGL
jgi:tetratricopeptide (TPR) repeat protein